VTCKLTNPDGPCSGTRVAAFCVRADDNAGQRDIAAALAPLQRAALWQVTGDDATAQPVDRRQHDLAMLAPWLPLLALLGALSWLGLVRLGGARRRLGLAVSVATLGGLGALTVALWDTGLGVWDALLAPLSAVAAGGLLATATAGAGEARRQRASRLGLAVGAAALALGLGELAAWVGGVPTRQGQAPQLLVPREHHRWQLIAARDLRWDELACGHLFSAGPVPAGDGPLIAHLGDSMTYGLGVPTQARFTSLVGGGRQLNLGVPGSSVDLAANILANARAAGLRPALTVVHAFAGNDIEELDTPLARCCGTARLTDVQGAPRCARRQAPIAPGVGSVLDLLAGGRPPWGLSVLAGYSRLAAAAEIAWLRGRRRRAAAAWVAVGDHAGDDDDDDDHTAARAGRRYQQILSALIAREAAAGGTVVVVIHPRRADVLAAVGRRRQPPRDESAAFEALVGAVVPQARRFSLRPALTRAAQRGEALFLAQGYDDPHYTAAGHGVVAAALREPLGAWLAAAESAL
jgi:hypothetical protein